MVATTKIARSVGRAITRGSAHPSGMQKTTDRLIVRFIYSLRRLPACIAFSVWPHCLARRCSHRAWRWRASGRADWRISFGGICNRLGAILFRMFLNCLKYVQKNTHPFETHMNTLWDLKSNFSALHKLTVIAAPELDQLLHTHLHNEWL